MEAPKDFKPKTTNTDLTVWEEETMIRNWSNEIQNIVLETESEINQNYK